MKKKNLKFAALVLAATATASQASIIFQVTKAGTQNGYDIFDLKVTGLDGIDAQNGPNGAGVSVFSMTATATTGSILTPGKSAPIVQGNTLNTSAGDPLSAAGGVGPAGDDFYIGTSYINMDGVAGFARTGATPATGNQHSVSTTSLIGSYSITASSYIGPASFTGGPGAFKGPDNPFLAEYIVTAGAAVTVNAKVYSNANSAGELYTIPLVVVAAGTSVSLTTPAAAPVTTIPGTGANYQATLLGANGSFALGGTPSGDAIAGIDFNGDPGALTLPSGATLLSAAAAAPYIALFNKLNNGSFDSIIDLGAGNTSGNLVISGLPNGVTVNAIAVVPEPTTVSLVGIGAVLAMNRRRRQQA